LEVLRVLQALLVNLVQQGLQDLRGLMEIRGH